MAQARFLLAVLLGLATADAASAQGVADRPFGGARGPRVVEIDPDLGRFRGPPIGKNGQDLSTIGAVPVPTVMNGGSFGPTGNDYYDDMKLATPSGPVRNSDTYRIAPAYRSPPLR